jgi:hypothetical protein
MGETNWCADCECDKCVNKNSCPHNGCGICGVENKGMEKKCCYAFATEEPLKVATMEDGNIDYKEERDFLRDAHDKLVETANKQRGIIERMADYLIGIDTDEDICSTVKGCGDIGCRECLIDYFSRGDVE